MTNIGITGKKIATKIDRQIIRKGGLQIITLPILKTKLTNEHDTLETEFGGYTSLVNYNKHRENQSIKDKADKRLRTLKRQQKLTAGRSNGDELPSLETLLDSCRGLNS